MVNDNAVSGAKSLISFLWHPTFLIDEKKEMADWMLRVFGYESYYSRDIFSHPSMGVSDEYEKDYSLFTLIEDVWIDCISPDIYFNNAAIAEIGRNHVFKRNRLAELGWFTHDMPALFESCRANGIRILDQTGQQVHSLGNSERLASADTFILYTHADDVGFSTELFAQSDEQALAISALLPTPHKLRGIPGTEIFPGNPLGIEKSAFHTILTQDAARAVKAMVGGLGGTVIHKAERVSLGVDCTYISVGNSIIEVAVPRADADASVHARLADKVTSMIGQVQPDVYDMITFRVADIEKAKRHLDATGIGLEHSEAGLIVTDPADCLGMRWGFTDAYVPGDPRIA